MTLTIRESTIRTVRNHLALALYLLSEVKVARQSNIYGFRVSDRVEAPPAMLGIKMGGNNEQKTY